MQTEPFTTTEGYEIYSYEYIEQLREADRKKSNPLTIIAQRGAQERMLSQDVDIWIGGGSRGGSKTFSLLLEALKDCQDQHFNGVIFRAEKPDLSEIENTSAEIFDQYGIYNVSESKKKWVFHNGGQLKFNYYSGDTYEEYKRRFQGHQYCYIGIDEITQMPYDRFKYIWTCNRNAYGLKNRTFGTCNPDPDSWVRKFLDWWIDEDGYAIPERDGVVRYCYMKGDSVDDIVWGDSRDEVYEKCKDDIDRNWNRANASGALDEQGYDRKRVFIPSVCFVRADLLENLKLLTSDPGYLARLANQGEEQVLRDLEANWNYKKAGDDMIKMADLDEIYANAFQVSKGHRYASCDVAFSGGDNFVMWLWEDWHIRDCRVLRVDSRVLVSAIEMQLREWGVSEECFTYDVNGLGQALKGFFPNAVPFNNMAAPIAESKREAAGIKALYRDLKSQAFYMFYKRTMDKAWSIEPSLLNRKFSGDGFKNLELRNILQKERKCVRRDTQSEDKGFGIIRKPVMKKFVGHSPDFFESLVYRCIFEIKKTHKKTKGLWRY